MLLIRQPWESQPQEPAELDPICGPAAQTSRVWIPIGAEGKLNANYAPSGVALAPAPIVGAAGVGLRFSGTESTSALSTNYGISLPSNDYALVAVVQRGATVGTTQWIFGTSDAAGGTYRGLYFSTGNVVQALFRDSGTTRNLTGTTTFAAGDLAVAVMVSRSTSEKKLYVNGRLEDDTISGAKTGGGTYFVLGAQGVTSSQTNWLNGDIFLAAVLPSVAFLPDSYFRELSANPWQLFAPRSIWVPVSAGGGSASTITAAAGASTASTLAASSTAASTPTAAAGTATASTVAASSTAASAITSATGAATASTLTGSAVVAGAITAAAGVGAGGTLVGDTLAAGSAAIVAADGVATTATFGGSSVAAAAIGVAAGAATASVMGGPGGATQITGGGWFPMPRRRTKKELDDERRKLGILPPEVVEEVAAVPVARRRITLQDLIGKKAAAEITNVDLSAAIAASKRRKRQRDDELLLLM